MSVSLKCIFACSETDPIASILICYIVFMSQNISLQFTGSGAVGQPGRIVPFLVVKVLANDTGHVPTPHHLSTDTTV